MIRCIAVDDEPMALEVIGRYCAKIDSLELKAVFREPVKAIEYITREKPDLVFLDINMPGISGMQLLQTLSNPPLIIFTTAYSHYAVESYDLNAIDYLLKPIVFERFLAGVNKAVTAISTVTATQHTTNALLTSEDQTIFIKSGPQTFQVKLGDILYFEKEGNYITVHLPDKKLLIRENIGDVFGLVPAADFIRVHKSYVVAVKHIVIIEVHQLTIRNEKIPIGASYRDSLRARLGIN